MTTGLKVHIEISTSGQRARVPYSLNFSMRGAKGSVETFAHDFFALRDNATDHRVRLNPPFSLSGER
jgi:hypothetical protein